MTRRGHPLPVSRLPDSAGTDDPAKADDRFAVETPGASRDAVFRPDKDSGMLPMLFPDRLRSAA